MSDDPTTAVTAPTDPIIPALEQRARDLSLSIVKPDVLGQKLRESLIKLAGDKAHLYHIGAQYDGKDIHVQIAALSPSFALKLEGDSGGSATLGGFYARTSKKGWRMAIGVEAEATLWSDAVQRRVKANDYLVKASFSVTVAR